MTTLKSFDFIKDLGKGAFGEVCLVKRKDNGEVLAMKRVKMAKLNKKERENALNEVRILASIVHPNIVGYHEAFFDENSRTLNIIMDFADDGDLASKIKQHKANKTRFAESEIWEILIQCTRGLKALHDNKIMHRDLKSANIFATKAKEYKLGDLNVSKVLKSSLVFTQTGTPYYASPEVWSEKPYSFKSDLWSLGCVMYELCALNPPFTATNMEKLYKSVTTGRYEPIMGVYSRELAYVIGKLLTVDTNVRYDCDDILSDKYVNNHMNFDNVNNAAEVNMACTIKMPYNMKEINQVLPKKEKKHVSKTPEREKSAREEEPQSRERLKTPTGQRTPTGQKTPERKSSNKEDEVNIGKYEIQTKKPIDYREKKESRTPTQERDLKVEVTDKNKANKYDILGSYNDRKALEKRDILKYGRE